MIRCLRLSGAEGCSAWLACGQFAGDLDELRIDVRVHKRLIKRGTWVTRGQACS
jgi:hypothetical protein